MIIKFQKMYLNMIETTLIFNTLFVKKENWSRILISGYKELQEISYLVITYVFANIDKWKFRI